MEMEGIQGMHSDVSSLEKASIWREASRIVRQEGIRAFWKGNLMLQEFLGVEGQGHNLSADLCIRLIGGGLAGITAASVTYPLDLVRTRLAAQTNVIYYRGMWHALHTISKEEGLFGLYKGLGATLLGVGPNLAISFSVYDTTRSYWHLHRDLLPNFGSLKDQELIGLHFLTSRPEDSTVLVSLACGSLSGIAASTEKQVEGAGFSVSKA
ncbi:hypothetical protein ACJIZ3_023071 [Penstemon smallii]|uniref:Uncharacterized protein n=1 Tax=Penstemon smallii TaxID=265156 RepID=A0ABD3TQD2_9LAMI